MLLVKTYKFTNYIKVVYGAEQFANNNASCSALYINNRLDIKT